ncbi:Unknown protein, partial [Striga hermonthica]
GRAARPAVPAGTLAASARPVVCTRCQYLAVKSRSTAVMRVGVHSARQHHSSVHLASPRTPQRITRPAACPATPVRMPVAFYAHWPVATHASTPSS